MSVVPPRQACQCEVHFKLPVIITREMDVDVSITGDMIAAIIFLARLVV